MTNKNKKLIKKAINNIIISSEDIKNAISKLPSNEKSSLHFDININDIYKKVLRKNNNI